MIVTHIQKNSNVRLCTEIAPVHATGIEYSQHDYACYENEYKFI